MKLTLKSPEEVFRGAAWRERLDAALPRSADERDMGRVDWTLTLPDGLSRIVVVVEDDDRATADVQVLRARGWTSALTYRDIIAGRGPAVYEMLDWVFASVVAHLGRIALVVLAVQAQAIEGARG